MKKHHRSLTVRLMTLLLALFCLCSCRKEAPDLKKIAEAFASFSDEGAYLLLTEKELHVDGKIIKTDDFRYEGKPCIPYFCEADRCYAYVPDSRDPSTVTLVFVAYETLEVTVVGTLSLAGEVLAAEYYAGSAYFRVFDRDRDGGTEVYYAYHFEEGEQSILAVNNLPVRLEGAADNSRSARYTIERDVGAIRVTDKRTGEEKRVTDELLSDCVEGKAIRELRGGALTGYSAAYEKDGIVYLLGGYTVDAGLRDRAYLFILRYDFKTHSLTYYTTVEGDAPQGGIVDLYIP